MADEYPIDAAAFTRTLVDQRAARYDKGLYRLTQLSLAYNSNRIEGSRLTEDQTRYLYETKTIDGVAHVNDVIETTNHFRAFDYTIDTLDEPITAARIKHLHGLLKSGTLDQDRPWATIGDWRTIDVEVGDSAPPPHAEVAAAMDALLTRTPRRMTFEDICDFHHAFEVIHPFYDGNGRVGRLLMFEQCLRNDIMPFVVLDEQKFFYYRGLSRYEDDPGFLRETFRSFQDAYYRTAERFVPRPSP